MAGFEASDVVAVDWVACVVVHSEIGMSGGGAGDDGAVDPQFDRDADRTKGVPGRKVGS